MKRLNLFIFLILLLFPLGQLTKLPLGIPEVNIYLQDIAISGLIIFWLIWHFLKKIPFSRPRLTKPIFLFFGVAMISLLANSPYLAQREIQVASFYLVRWIFYAGIYFVVSELKLKLEWVLIWAGIAASILGLFQYFLYPDLANLAYLGWDPHLYRVFGTFLDPGFLGMILVLTLILIVSLLWNKYQHVNMLTCWGAKIGGLITYVTLALTYSRSSYLAYLAGMGALAWIKKAPKFFLIALLAGVLTILLLPRPPGSEGVRLEREESAWARVRNWKQSLVIFKDRPILGVGFDTYRYAQRDSRFLEEETWQKTHSGAGADSSLLFVLATTGIVGLIAYLKLQWEILKIKNLAILGSSLALLVHSWFLNSLFYPGIMLWMWVLVASSSTAKTQSFDC